MTSRRIVCTPVLGNVIILIGAITQQVLNRIDCRGPLVNPSQNIEFPFSPETTYEAKPGDRAGLFARSGEVNIT